MFTHLTNFSYKRNWKEAVGFYLFCVFIVFIFGFFVGLSLSMLGVNITPYTQVVFVKVTSVVYCLTISSFLLKEKKLLKNPVYVILVLLGCFLAVWGAFFGLIVPAFITTRNHNG
ncbi:MAG: EamA family transporter [Patescibacteria group bacterium]